jgi:hypothetical protein
VVNVAGSENGQNGENDLSLQPIVEKGRYLLNVQFSESALASMLSKHCAEVSINFGDWLPKPGTGRMVCTILEVIISRRNRQNSLVVVSPWNDRVSAQYGPHPALVAIDRVQTWQRDLASVLMPSFNAIAQRENLTVARISQMMMLSRLSQPALDRLRVTLTTAKARNEAFSLRKLFQDGAISPASQRRRSRFVRRGWSRSSSRQMPTSSAQQLRHLGRGEIAA